MQKSEKNEKDKNNTKYLLKKKRRENKIQDTLKRTIKNKILKDNFKKSRREFKKSESPTIFEKFKNYISAIGKMQKNHTIHKNKASRIKSQVQKQYNQRIQISKT